MDVGLFEPQAGKQADLVNFLRERPDFHASTEAPQGWGEVGGTDQTAPTPEQQQAIVAAVQQIVGPNVAIEVHDGQMFATMPGSGERRSIGGLAIGRLIQAAGASPYFERHLNHEAIHALRNLGVISPGEWSVLEAAAQREGWVQQDAGRSGNYRPDQLLEEAVAERFAQWATSDKPPLGMFGRILAKVRRFFEALRNALAGRAAKSAEGVFEDIKAGKMGEREPSSRDTPRRGGAESVERTRDGVLKDLVDRGLIEKADAPGIRDLMLSAEKERGASDASPETVTQRVIAKHAGTGRIAQAALVATTFLTDIGHTVQMMVAPMAHGGASDQARAVTKDFANFRRWVRWDGNREMAETEKNFTRDQLRRMWDAADVEGVARSRNETTANGLASLDPDERAAVKRIQGLLLEEFVRGRKIGTHNIDEARPSYVPRMVADMFDPQKQAHVVRDFRTAVLALTKLREANIGRMLVNQIQALGAQTGDQLISVGSVPPGGGRNIDPFTGISVTTPNLRRRKYETVEETEAAAQRKQEHIRSLQDETGFKWVTIEQNDAFWSRRWRGTDEDGRPIFESVPIYVRSDFHGPLLAVMRKPSNALYRAAMDLKSRMMGTIMYGVAHLAVIGGRSVELNPNVYLLAKRGSVARQDRDTMERLITNGLVPIGNRQGYGRAEDIEATYDPNPGRSWTSQILAAPVSLVSKPGADAIKRAADKLGDMTHGWMWEQVGNIQAGAALQVEHNMLAKGLAPKAAAKVGAIAGNRIGGALPEESLNPWVRRALNLALFSVSYRLGGGSIVKDALVGLPKDVRAQIRRDHGEAELTKAVSGLKRTARSLALISIGLTIVGNAVTQSAFDVVTGRHTGEQELEGYQRRAVAEMKFIRDQWATPLLNPLALFQAISPLAEHEPGKENRVLWGFDKYGTGQYFRNPVGKTGEDLMDYAVHPLRTLQNAYSPYMHAVTGLLSNQDSLGRSIYDPYVDTPARFLRAARDYMAFVVRGSTPSTATESAAKLMTGNSDNPGRDTGKIVAGGFGFSLSQGFPGGPLGGKLFRVRKQQEYEFGRVVPKVKELARAGKQTEAVTLMRSVGIPQGLMRYYLTRALNPHVTPDQIIKTLEGATPEQREMIMQELQETRSRAAH